MEWYTKIKYNCKRATFLIERKEQVRLTFRESAELHIHLHSCPWCRLYRKQSIMIGKMIQRIFVAEEENILSMDISSKIRLQELVERKLNGNN